MTNKVIVYIYEHEYHAEVYCGNNMIPYGEYGRDKKYSKKYIETKITKIFGSSVFEYI